MRTVTRATAIPFCLCVVAALATALDKGGNGNGGGGGGGGGGGSPPPDPRIVLNGGGSIYVMNEDGSNLTLVLAAAGSASMEPSWSPDGGRIAFNGTLVGYGLYVVASDGSNLELVTPLLDEFWGRPAWSPVPAPDGQPKILFTDLASDGNTEVFAVNLDGSGRVRLTWDNIDHEYGLSWSPDGTRFAAVMWRVEDSTLSYDARVYDLGVSYGELAVVASASVVQGIPGSPLAATQGLLASDWSHGGELLCVTAELPGEGADLWGINPSNPSAALQLTATHQSYERTASWSPDDARIVYHTIGNGPNGGIFVLDVASGAATRILSAGYAPDWR